MVEKERAREKSLRDEISDFQNSYFQYLYK